MKETTKSLYHERILKVLLFIQAHLDEPLPLESLAAVSHFSPTHFHRIFKGMVGETVSEHIRRIRLERCATRLALGRTTVTDESFAAGYETVESFSRAFKNVFGCPPSQYRTLHWQQMYDKIPGLVHYLPDDARSGLTIQPTEEMSMEIRQETIEPMRVAFVRHIGPYMECKTAWDILAAWAGPKGLFGPETRFIGISYDDPHVTPPEKIRYDACITVNDEVVGEGEVGTQDISGGDYVICTHRGPYENLEQTYAELMGKGLPQIGREFADKPAFEIYLNNPELTPPKELVTEIYLPLK